MVATVAINARRASRAWRTRGALRCDLATVLLKIVLTQLYIFEVMYEIYFRKPSKTLPRGFTLGPGSESSGLQYFCFY